MKFVCEPCDHIEKTVSRAVTWRDTMRLPATIIFNKITLEVEDKSVAEIVAEYRTRAKARVERIRWALSLD